MDTSQAIMDSGVIYSVFESGIWIGYKLPNNPIEGWIRAEPELFDLMVTKYHINILTYLLHDRFGDTLVCMSVGQQENLS